MDGPYGCFLYTNPQFKNWFFFSFISISRTAPLLLNQVESLPNEVSSIRWVYLTLAKLASTQDKKVKN